MFDCFSPVLINYTTAVAKAIQRKQALMSCLATRIPTSPLRPDPYRIKDEPELNAAMTSSFFTPPSTYL